MYWPHLFWTLAFTASLSNAFAVPSWMKSNETALEVVSDFNSNHRRQEDDPTSFSWVRKMVAIGDSYTAGIGSGEVYDLPYQDLENSRLSGDCSRYQHTYPVLMKDIIGDPVEHFQYLACSGARTGGIYDQVAKMDSDVDLVVMTAGGNDLCLAKLIEKCVVLSFYGAQACEDVIDKAFDNLEYILKDNIKHILNALKGKMHKDGIVVYLGYAEFFNTESDKCDKESWAFPWWFAGFSAHTVFPLPLSQQRRNTFNKMVVEINTVIRDTIHEMQSSLPYQIEYSDWDVWIKEGIKGQMCRPESTGKYPDPDQPDLSFFKPWTYVGPRDLKRSPAAVPQPYELASKEEQKRRDSSLYNSVLAKSPDPRSVARGKLDKRDPAPANCPGDDGLVNLGVWDIVGKWFHPNEKGHEAMASFALATAIDLRAKVLGVSAPSCAIDSFTCWKQTGSRGYATVGPMNDNIKKFCGEAKGDGYGWRYSKEYFAGTPDHQEFVVQLSEEVSDFDSGLCEESFQRIVHGCDGNDSENPLNWKSGGRWIRGDRTYEIHLKRANRPWPPPKEPYGSCDSQYYGVLSGYWIRGAGFASWEHENGGGDHSMLSCIKGCVGLGVTRNDFKYFEKPDENGMEWEYYFQTPIWTRARCFGNEKVQKCAGGLTNGCSGSG